MHPLREKLLLAAVPPVAHGYVRFLRVTMSLKFDNREVLVEARHDAGGFILAFWDSRFLMMPYAYSGGRITVLLSRHRDAEMLARMIARFGLDTSRGSSTDSGAAALRDILRKGFPAA